MADQNYKLRFDFIANNTKFNSALTASSNKLKQFGSQMTKTGRMLSTRLSLPLAAVGGIAIKQAANFERLQTTLNTLTGSADEGAKAFERLVQFSAKTPFQLDELVKVNNTLMGFGLNANEAFDSLSMLGDISGIVGGDLQSIGIAFGQAAAEGRVMTRDLRQFINNGVPILDILATSMGVARGEIMDMASEGKITFEILNNAFRNATGEGGKFEGGMNTLSQTLNGLFSTLKDNVNIALAELGQEIAETLNLKEGIPALSKKIGELVDGFKSLDDDTKKLIIQIAALAVALPPLTIALGALISSVGTITTFFVALNPIVIALTASIVALAAGINKIANATNVGFFETLKNAFLSLGNPINFAVRQNKSLVKSFDEISDVEIDTEEVENAAEKTEEAATSTRKLATALDLTAKGYKKMNDAALETGTILTEVPKKTKETTTMLVDSMSVIQPFIQGFANSISESFSKSDGSFTGFAASMLDVIGDLIIQMGLAAIAASNLAKTFAIPIAGAAAGLAAVALGGVIKGIANRVRGQGLQEFAKGGIVSGPTTALIGEYPGARSNPEVVAPLSKLKSMIDGGTTQGEFVLRGQDLVVALQRAERNRNRFK